MNLNDAMVEISSLAKEITFDELVRYLKYESIFEGWKSAKGEEWDSLFLEDAGYAIGFPTKNNPNFKTNMLNGIHLYCSLMKKHKNKCIHSDTIVTEITKYKKYGWPMDDFESFITYYNEEDHWNNYYPYYPHPETEGDFFFSNPADNK